MLICSGRIGSIGSLAAPTVSDQITLNASTDFPISSTDGAEKTMTFPTGNIPVLMLPVTLSVICYSAGFSVGPKKRWPQATQ